MKYLKFELFRFFNRPLVFILAAVFSVLSALIYISLKMNVLAMLQASQDLQSPVTTLLISFISNLNVYLMILCSIVSGYCFANERNSFFTILKLSNLKTRNYIIVKFILAFVISLVCVSGIFFYGFIFQSLGLADSNYLFFNYSALLLNAMLYCSIGVLSGSLFQGAILLSFFFSLTSCLLINFLPQLFSGIGNSYVHELITYLSLNSHFYNIQRGFLSTSDLLYYFSAIFLFLFFSLKTFEFRERE